MQMHPLLFLVLTLIDIYEWILIFWIILSLLITFGVVNTYHPIVNKINYVLYRLTEPVLKPIRKYIPPMGGIDLSPLVVFIVLNFIQYSLMYYF